MIREHPEFHLDSRNLLHLMNCETGTIEIQGHTYELLDTNFPTVDWKRSLCADERGRGDYGALTGAFQNCESCSGI